MVIYPGLLRSDFLITNDDEYHAWEVWLWKDVESMVSWSDNYGHGDVGNNADACHIPMNLICDEPMQLIGHLHFVKNKWDMETVSHELLHGLFIYLKCFVPDFPRTIYMNWMEDEEPICYEFGYWADWLYRWLWKRNPNEPQN